MYEVNSVLTNKFDAANYIPASTNIAQEPDSNTTSINTNSDSRRYTQFDRTATNAGSTTMSFNDFVDMVNPLQHIPVISSVYRSITGDTINPVSRVAGDIMYSAPMGLASAAISGINAIANSALEATTGTDGMGHVMASLFGTNNSTPNTSIAEATPAVVTFPALNPTPVTAAPLDVLATVVTPVKSTSAATAQPTSPPAPVVVASEEAAAPAIMSNQKAFPLDRSRINTKMPSMTSNDIESQNRIISLSEGSHSMRLGHTLYTSPLMNGPKPMPVGSTTPPPPPQTPVATVPPPSPSPVSASSADIETETVAIPASTVMASSPNTSLLSTQKDNVPPALFDDVMILKRINQYKDFATAPSLSGLALDTMN